MTTNKNRERCINILKSWGKNLNIFFYSDHNEPGLKCIKVSDRDDYHSNEEKNINTLNYLLAIKPQYKWFYFCDDDTFPILANLEKLIANADPSKVYGRVLSFSNSPDNRIFKKVGTDLVYPAGGPGYLLSNQVLLSYENFINFDTGFSDVSVGLNLQNRFEISDVQTMFTHAPWDYKHSDDFVRNQVSYHYIKNSEHISAINQILNI